MKYSHGWLTDSPGGVGGVGVVAGARRRLVGGLEGAEGAIGVGVGVG